MSDLVRVAIRVVDSPGDAAVDGALIGADGIVRFVAMARARGWIAEPLATYFTNMRLLSRATKM